MLIFARIVILGAGAAGTALANRLADRSTARGSP
jgi:glycerol-3-phosphate dehydrogenase